MVYSKKKMTRGRERVHDKYTAIDPQITVKELVSKD